MGIKDEALGNFLPEERKRTLKKGAEFLKKSLRVKSIQVTIIFQKILRVEGEIIAKTRFVSLLERLKGNGTIPKTRQVFFHIVIGPNARWNFKHYTKDGAQTYKA